MTPTKKRAEFIATSAELFPHEGELILSLSDIDDSLLELFREGSSIYAELYPNTERLTLRKAMIIDRLDVLYLDFQQHDYLHRIAVSIPSLDPGQLKRDLRRLTDGISSLFTHM